MNVRKVLAVFAAATLALALAGCGDNDKSEGTAAHSGDHVYRIGLQAPLSGDQKQLGEGMLEGAQLAAKEINEDGDDELHGRRIEIVPIDDTGDVQTGIAAAKQAIASHLDGVVGPYNSSVGLKTLPLYIDAGLVPIRLTSDNATDGMGYTLQPMTDQIAPVTTRAIHQWLNAKKVAIIYDSTEAYTKTVSAAVRKGLKDDGVKVVADIAIKPGAKSYSSVVKKAAAGGADVIYSAVYFPEGGLIARAMQQQNVGAECLADYGSYDSGFIKVAGRAAAERCAVVGVPAPDDFSEGAEKVKEFVDQFRHEPGTWSPFTYDSVEILIDAVEDAGGFDAAKLKAELGDTHDWDGWTGDVKLDPKTGNRIDAPLVVTGVEKDGHFHVDKAWAQAVGAPY